MVEGVGGGAGAAVAFSGTGAPAWPEETTMPAASGQPRAGLISGTLYVVHPTTPALYAYDPSADSWSQMTDPPGVRKQSAAAVADGKLVVTGGTSGGNWQGTPLVYDPGSDSWTEGTAMPTPRRMHAAFAPGDGTVYCCAGNDDSNTDVSTVEQYDVSADTWTAKTAMPSVVTDCPGAANGTYGFVLGESTMFRYDPSGDSWTTMTAPPRTRTNRPGFVWDSGLSEFWLIGGYDGGALTDVDRFDPAADSYTTDVDALSAGRYDLAAVMIDGDPWAIGGSDSGFTDQDTVFRHTGPQPVLTASGPGLYSIADRATGSVQLQNQRTGVRGLNVFLKDGDGLVVTEGVTVEIYKIPK